MSSLALAWAQFRFERRMFWRNPSAAFFNFALPLLLLVLIGAVFATKPKELDILIPGIAGMSVVATTFTALAFNLTYLRQEGILKRMRGVPIPTVSYLAGLFGSAVMNAFLQVAIVVVLGQGPVRRGLARRLAAAGRLHRPRRRLLRLARRRLRAPDPERRLGAGLHERGLPAADLHLGRLLLGRRLPADPARDRGGAAADARDRRALGGDHRRRRRRPRRGGAGRRRLDAGGRRPRRALLPLGVARRQRRSRWPWRRSQRSCSRQSGTRSASRPQKRGEWSITSRWATSCSTT